MALDLATIPLRIVAHPRLYVTPENRDGLCQRRLRAPYQQIYQSTVAYAARWAEAELPDEPVGFSEPCTFKLYESFDETILAEIARVCAHEAPAALVTNAFLYALTKEAAYAEVAKRWLLHVARWDVEGGSGIYFGNDLPCSVLLRSMALTYDWIHDALSDEERRTARASLTARARQIRSFISPFGTIYNGKYCNHASTNTAAMMLTGLALYDEIPDAPKWVDHGIRLFREEFLPVGGSDGSWQEGVHYWHPTALWGVFAVADPLLVCLGVNLYNHPWLEKGGEYVITASAQDVRLRMGFGDGATTDRLDVASFMAIEKWATIYNRPEGFWLYNDVRETMRGGLCPYDYLWTTEERAVHEPRWRPQRRFENAEVYLKSDWTNEAVMLAFRSAGYVGYEGYSHNHADHNSFTLNAYGERLLIDGGVYDGWGGKHYTQDYITSFVHNTILVSGTPQRPMHPDAVGSIETFEPGDSLAHVCGEAAAAYMGRLDLFRRHLWFVDRRYVVILDQLVAPEAERFGWQFHGLAPMNQQGNLVRIEAEKAAAELHFIAPATLTAHYRDGLRTNPKHLPREGYVEHHGIMETEPLAEAVFLVVIAPYRKGETPPQVDVHAQATGWDVAFGDTRTLRIDTPNGTDAKANARCPIRGQLADGGQSPTPCSREQ